MLSLAVERDAPAPMVSNTFLLQGAVKALNMGIVVWSSEATVAHLDAGGCQGAGGACVPTLAHAASGCDEQLERLTVIPRACVT